MGLGSLVFDLLWKIPIVAIYTAVYELTPAARARPVVDRAC